MAFFIDNFQSGKRNAQIYVKAFSAGVSFQWLSLFVLWQYITPLFMVDYEFDNFNGAANRAYKMSV